MAQCNKMASDVNWFSTESALASGLILSQMITSSVYDKHKTDNKKSSMKTDNKELEVLLLKKT